VPSAVRSANASACDTAFEHDPAQIPRDRAFIAQKAGADAEHGREDTSIHEPSDGTRVAHAHATARVRVLFPETRAPQEGHMTLASGATSAVSSGEIAVTLIVLTLSATALIWMALRTSRR
jgi:hypothetical protein